MAIPEAEQPWDIPPPEEIRSEKRCNRQPLVAARPVENRRTSTLHALRSEMLVRRHPGVEQGKSQGSRGSRACRNEAVVSDTLTEIDQHVLEPKTLAHAPLHRLLPAILRMRKNQRERQWTLAFLQFRRVQGQCGNAHRVETAAEEDASPALCQATRDGAAQRGVEFLDDVAGFPLHLALRHRIPVFTHLVLPLHDAKYVARRHPLHPGKRSFLLAEEATG